MKNLIFFTIIFFFTSCKKENIQNSNIHKNIIKKNITNKIDTIVLNINENYDLEISSGKKEIINFLQPIKNELMNENSYAQILYNKKNIIINIEIGDNANLYEDFYLSKTNPIILEKIVCTTIEKKKH